MHALGLVRKPYRCPARSFPNTIGEAIRPQLDDREGRTSKSPCCQPWKVDPTNVMHGRRDAKLGWTERDPSRCRPIGEVTSPALLEHAQKLISDARASPSENLHVGQRSVRMRNPREYCNWGEACRGRLFSMVCDFRSWTSS